MNRVTAYSTVSQDDVFTPKTSWLVAGNAVDVFSFVKDQAARAIKSGAREKYHVQIEGRDDFWVIDHEASSYNYLFGA